MKVSRAFTALALITLAGLLPACSTTTTTASRTRPASEPESMAGGHEHADESYATTPVHVGMTRAEVNRALGKTKPVFNTVSGRINFEAVETANGKVLILPYVYKNRSSAGPQDVIEHPPSYMTVLGQE